VTHTGCGVLNTRAPLLVYFDIIYYLISSALADVRGGLEDYRDAVERTEELDEQFERTGALIDEIVYELYGLTDEEIEIVEEAVGE